MLAAPLVLLLLQYEPVSFNVHKSEFSRGSETDSALGLLNWLVPFFQGTLRQAFGTGSGVR